MKTTSPDDADGSRTRESLATGQPDLPVRNDIDEPGLPRYWPSRTPEEWRAYHRNYYREHAERRRAQARDSHLRKVLRQVFGSAIPRSLRLLFLRDSLIR